MHAIGAGLVVRELNAELKQLARRHQSGAMNVTVRRGAEPEPPASLVEPADMVAIASPCHPWEPIKIVDNWVGPVSCPVCGARFAI